MSDAVRLLFDIVLLFIGSSDAVRLLFDIVLLFIRSCFGVADREGTALIVGWD
jgi:hypothetical protein